MNEELQKFGRDKLKEGLGQCTKEEQHRFKQMYAGGKLEKDINDVVDDMEEQKITKLFTDNWIREPAIEMIMGYFEEEREAIRAEVRLEENTWWLEAFHRQKQIIKSQDLNGLNDLYDEMIKHAEKVAPNTKDLQVNK